jgi:hypothetical protein
MPVPWMGTLGHGVDWTREHHEIKCNGRAALVSLNLFEALQQFTNIGELGFLWIDRICIDQENDAETADQVGMMSRIYGQATSVIVWLGRGGEDSKAAFEIHSNFSAIFDQASQGILSEEQIALHDPGGGWAIERSFLAKFGLQDTSDSTFAGWINFFRRSWFYRRWTLQEVAHARYTEVFCGNQQFSWHKLKFLVQYFATRI